MADEGSPLPVDHAEPIENLDAGRCLDSAASDVGPSSRTLHQLDARLTLKARYCLELAATRLTGKLPTPVRAAARFQVAKCDPYRFAQQTVLRLEIEFRSKCMLSKVLVFLKDRLNAHLSAAAPGTSTEDRVVFVEDDKMDPINFKVGAVSILLINIEEEKTLRAPDRYSGRTSNGDPERGQPEIRLNLYVLFAVRFKDYEQGLSYLSRVLRYFQNHRIFTHHSAPELSDEIDQLVLELITLPLAEQNDLWNALRTTYHPCLLYKVQMVVVRDEEALATPAVEQPERAIGGST